jgi:lipopolysaccharide/colanic/teichoic acid biosynthesis glycosyltransferase
VRPGKRLVDLAIALVVLVATAPLLLLVALLVRRDGGPVLFRQARVGRYGRPFSILKIRTMSVDTEHQGLQITAAYDRRITKVGAVLRRTKVDEIPQLWNVVRGEMSVVGPRPEVQRYVDLYTEQQREVLEYTPGITDPASLHYIAEEDLLGQCEDPHAYYVSVVMPDKVERNLAYARRATVFSDLWLVARTALLPLGRLVGRELPPVLVDPSFVAPSRRPDSSAHLRQTLAHASDS